MTDRRQPVELRLEGREGLQAPVYTVAGKSSALLGRSRACAICLEEPGVSRRHAALEWRGDRWHVTDLESRHGTFVNTIRLEAHEPVPLSDGDLLRVGPCRLAVARSAADDAPRPHVEPEAPVGAATGGEEPATAALRSAGGSRSQEAYATRATMFLRLKDDDSDVRELSWKEFAERYQPVIAGFARNAGMTGADADDIVQTVLLGFFRVSDRFEYDPAKGRFRGYLKRVTLNAIRAGMRRQRPLVGIAEDPVGAPSARIDVIWNSEWTRQMLERALDDVRPGFEARTWDAFELYGRRGVPVDEVGSELEMSAESVRHAKSRIARAVRRRMAELRAAEG